MISFCLHFRVISDWPPYYETSFDMCCIYQFLCISHVQNIYTNMVAQTVKNPPSMQETWVQSLGWKDPLEKEMATHSSILAWEIPWTEEPGGLQSVGSQKSQTGLSD